MNYPQRYFLTHPILVVTILIDYWLRRHGYRPDEWHKADLELLTKTASKNTLREKLELKILKMKHSFILWLSYSTRGHG